MRDKLRNAKSYVAENKGMFIVGGVVVFVYTATMVAAVFNYKNVAVQYEIAKL